MLELTEARYPDTITDTHGVSFPLAFLEEELCPALAKIDCNRESLFHFLSLFDQDVF